MELQLIEVDGLVREAALLTADPRGEALDPPAREQAPQMPDREREHHHVGPEHEEEQDQRRYGADRAEDVVDVRLLELARNHAELIGETDLHRDVTIHRDLRELGADDRHAGNARVHDD